jgi:ribonuclease R
VFRMGDKVKIKVVAANLEKRQLDYELVLGHISSTEKKVLGEKLQGKKEQKSSPKHYGMKKGKRKEK